MSPPHLAALVSAAQRSSGALSLLTSLCDDVGPRFPCTPGDAAAVAWALETMRAVGLGSVRAEPAPATLWQRGAEACSLVLPSRREGLVVTALGGSVPTEGVLEAEVVELASLDALDALPEGALAGKVAYLHHVMPRLRDGTGYNGAAAVRTAGPSKAAKKGAAACLVRSAGTDSLRAAHTGALWYEPGATPIPAAALAIPDAERLHRAIAAGRTHVSLRLDCAPLPVGTSANVLGDLPGTDPSGEMVLFGAHLDSWDLSVGALDDGAGCAIALEVARLLAALPTRPRRTIRFALFANEELGIGGGRAYADTHASEAGRIVAAMEADQGDGAPWALRVPAAAREHGVTRELVAALEPLGVALDAGPSRGGVDISPLRQLGVPFVDLRQDATRYFDFHHTENDVLENVSPGDLRLATTAFAAAVYTLACADDRLPP